jgi:hypothetical protein
MITLAGGNVGLFFFYYRFEPPAKCQTLASGSNPSLAPLRRDFLFCSLRRPNRTDEILDFI